MLSKEKRDLMIKIKDFIDDLKDEETCGQDTYSFSYIYEDEFELLDNILDEYFDGEYLKLD